MENMRKSKLNSEKIAKIWTKPVSRAAAAAIYPRAAAAATTTSTSTTSTTTAAAYFPYHFTIFFCIF
jgi:peptidoglycan hydrolase CwlO-like protein